MKPHYLDGMGRKSTARVAVGVMKENNKMLEWYGMSLWPDTPKVVLLFLIHGLSMI